MLTLLATNTVQGGAGSASVISYTITGLDNAVPKVTQGQLSNTPGSLYAATGTGGYVSEIDLVNTSASPVAITMYVNGVAASNQIWTATIPANGKAIYGRDGWKLYDVTGFLQYVGSTGPQGLKGSRWLGAWSGATAYVIDDVVFSVGSAWIAIVAGTNHIPPTLPATSDSFWNAVSIKGDQGIQGIQGNPGVVTTVTAGAGLTGGGSASTVTLDVVANADGSIVVAADDVKVGVLATDVQHGTRGGGGVHANVAAAGAAGFMTGADKTKLDGIAVGANLFVAEDAQDAVGAILTDTATIDTTYNDVANTMTFDVIDGSLTLAKLANLAQSRMIGRASGAGTGVPQALTPAQIAVILGLPISIVRDYGATFDHRVVFDGACSTGANTKITSASAAFVAADLNKRVVLATAGASSAPYAGTITNVDSATQVTVSPAISTTASAKGLQIHTDDLTAWNSLVTDVNAFTSPGARVYMERTGTNRSGISAAINTFTKQVTIEGIGGSYNHDTGDYTKGEGSVIAYAGVSQSTNGTFGAVLTFAPNSGATAQAMTGPYLRHFSIDCRNGDHNPALMGISLASTHGYEIDDVFMMDPGAVGILMGVIQPGTAGALGEDKGTDRGFVTNYHCRCLENAFIGANTAQATLTATTTTSALTLSTVGQSLVLAAANGLSPSGYVWVMTILGYPVLVNYTAGGGTTTLTGCTVSLADTINAPTTVSGSNVVQAVPNNASCGIFDGDLTANTNLSVFEMWQLSIGTNWGPAGLEYRNCDTIDSRQVVVNGGNITNDGAINRIRRAGVRLNGSTGAAPNVALPARNNTFRGGDAGAGGVSSMALLNTGAKMAFPTGPNYWDLYQLGNGAPAPTIELGSYFDWSPNGGLLVGLRNLSHANQAFTAATLTSVSGSVMLVPPQAFQVGTTFRWRVHLNKTAAGIAARVFHVRVGTAGTTADAIVQTFTSGVPTAALDSGYIEIEYVITATGASATGTGASLLMHNGVAGLAAVANPFIAGVPTAFNSSSSGFLYIGLTLTTGAAEVVNSNYVTADLVRVGNQGA